MKRIFKKSALFCMILTICFNSALFAVANNDNLLSDGGFEKGISNTTGGAGKRTWETTVEKG
ncbi:MAG: hypothetical protein IKV86_04130, partial [Clostridia bacterium]|nr:hypothetical protein [Clostridia bacterium]